jgi:hypothetical protein
MFYDFRTHHIRLTQAPATFGLWNWTAEGSLERSRAQLER